LKPFHSFSNTSQSFLKSKHLLFLLSGLLIFASCSYEDVEVRNVTDVKIKKLDKEGISFTADLEIVNPNGYPIKITETNADLYLEGNKAGKAILEKKVVIPSHFNDVVEVQVRADFDGGSLQLLPIIIGAAMSKKVDLQAKGYIRAKSFVISQKIDFDYSHQAKF